jgi:prepilin peptidase CpaA
MSWGSLIAPTLILLGALITDVRTHKIYNIWIIISILIALTSSYLFFGFEGLQSGAQGGALALVITLPLVILGALGAGDMKILFAFGLATTYSAVFSVIVVSFIWAGIVGIIMAIYRGRAKALAISTVKLITSQTRNQKSFHKIPYTIALVLAWVTYVAFAFKNGAFL